MKRVYVITAQELWLQTARFRGKLSDIAVLMGAVGAIVLTALCAADRRTRFAGCLHGMPGPALLAVREAFVLAGG